LEKTVIQNNDIIFVLSGGSENTDPALSFGGDPSAVPVGQGANALFVNVTADQAEAGYADYRCIYAFNHSLTDTLYNCGFFIKNQVEGGAEVGIGVLTYNEEQKITIIGTITGGSIVLKYEQTTITVAGDPDPRFFGRNMQDAVKTIPGLEDVLVITSLGVTQGGDAIYTFSVQFFDLNTGNRFHPLFTHVSNTLTPTPVVAVARYRSGSPINTVAELTSSGETAPFGIAFPTYTSSTRPTIGHLRPGDAMPIWIKRTVPPNSQPLYADGFSVVVAGTFLP
jgi:hypothetical protein